MSARSRSRNYCGQGTFLPLTNSKASGMAPELCAAANDTGWGRPSSNINYFFCSRRCWCVRVFGASTSLFICYITWALIRIEWTPVMGSNFLGPSDCFLLSREHRFWWTLNCLWVFLSVRHCVVVSIIFLHSIQFMGRWLMWKFYNFPFYPLGIANNKVESYRGHLTNYKGSFTHILLQPNAHR